MAKNKPKRFAFTVARLRVLPTPKKGRIYAYDTKCAGLCVCKSSRGTTVFYRYGKVNGRPVRIRLGRFPDLPIDQARKAATDLSGQIAAGKDPAAERRGRRGALTFGELFDWYLEQHSRPHKRTWKIDQQQYDRYLRDRWHGRKIDTIHKRDVATLHTTLGADHGHYAANRLRALLHKIFSLAIDHGLLEGRNPVQGIKKFPEVKRDRFLDQDELRRFFAALLEEENTTVRDCLLMLLFTGARRMNTYSMAWADIDFRRALWRIPNTKTGEPVVLPLSSEAMTILQERWKTANQANPWVFPSKRKGGHLADATKVWKGVLDRAGLENLRLHDLRRTLGSWQALGGSSLQVIGRSLGHKNVATTEIYARLTMDPIRKSIEKATSAMVQAAGVKLIEEGPADGE